MIKTDISNSKSAIETIVILAIAFIIGLYVQIKKIKRVKQEKAFTWELEIYHSAVCITYFSFHLFIEILEHFIPEVCNTTKRILCTSAWFIKTWGVTAIFLHSLSISMCKYVVIVRCKGMSTWRRNTERIVISAIVAFPILWTVLGFISAGGTPVFHHDFIASSIDMCNGIGEKEDYVELSMRSFFCGFTEKEDKKGNWDFIFIMTEFFCFIQSVITLVVNMNILEAFLYLRIFASMSR